MAQLTVACVEVADFCGRGFEYVRKMQSMCARHLPPHRFVCLSDREGYGEGIETIPAEANGWWTKLELFRPGQFDGQVVYFDLDVVISGSISTLIEHCSHGFWALDDFAWPLSNPNPHLPEKFWPTIEKWCGGRGTVNSSVMIWHGDCASDCWTEYTPEAAAGLWGDQNWITRTIGTRINLIPPGWARSYKFDQPGPPITVYHGKPRPHEVVDPGWY